MMEKLSTEKWKKLEKLSDNRGVIRAIAIDQRGSLQKMLDNCSKGQGDAHGLERFKFLVSKELTPYASSILLDPEYGWPAAEVKHNDAGLIMAYEITGYDPTQKGRLPRLLPGWSVKRLKEKGADAIKLLLYYDVDEETDINEQKHAFVERVGSECMAEDVPFFLEIVTYDTTIVDTKGLEYAKVKPHKVNEAVREFSKPRYGVDVLKVETPVNMNYVEGYGKEEPVYSQEEARRYFKEQSDATDLPFIFLSAGVSAELFRQTLRFAHEAGSEFNGVLCGRATWKGSIEPFAKDGEQAAHAWFQTEGIKNITSLNQVLSETAKPWWERLRLKKE